MNGYETTDDVYKPPEAELTLPQKAAARFYVVSGFKLLLLYLVTMGLYVLYWFYRHWKQIKTHEDASVVEREIWPVPRGLFSIFFAHSLFRRFDNAVQGVEPVNWRPGLLAILYVIFTIIGNLADSLPRYGLRYFWVIFAFAASLLIIGYVIYRAQAVANIACGEPGGHSNARLTLPNLLWILLGLVFWLAVGVGFVFELGYFPELAG